MRFFPRFARGVMVGAVSGFEWDPDAYLSQMVDEIPGYGELQDAVAAAANALAPETVLELGTGTGETASHIRAKRWTGVDSSEAMLARARERLPDADLRLARLEDPLPEGPFDLVVSALAVHHLDAEAKRDLFRRIARVSDQFVLGDVVTPERLEDAVIEIDGVYDVPSSVAEQLAWLDEADFDADATYVRPDLAVFTARKR
jgi:tRNA (cmo5U34)-methyltransferase